MTRAARSRSRGQNMTRTALAAAFLLLATPALVLVHRLDEYLRLRRRPRVYAAPAPKPPARWADPWDLN